MKKTEELSLQHSSAITQGGYSIKEIRGYIKTETQGRCRENVFHDAASMLPGTLSVLLRDVHPQPWLDVFTVLSVHFVELAKR